MTVLAAFCMTSCEWFELDNTEQHNATVSGKILDAATGETVQTEINNGGSIRFVELGWTDKDGNPLTFSDIICTEDTIVEDLETKIYSKKALEIIKTSLTPRERRIIVLRYGLNNTKPKTQRQIAEMLNISRSYVSRIEKSGIEKIRAEFDRFGAGKYM